MRQIGGLYAAWTIGMRKLTASIAETTADRVAPNGCDTVLNDTDAVGQASSEVRRRSLCQQAAPSTRRNTTMEVWSNEF
jgi:hypothetical protein